MPVPLPPSDDIVSDLGGETGDSLEWHCREQPLYGHGFTFFRVALVALREAVA